LRILVPLLPGLGDALTASPILRAAIESGAELDILTMLDPVAEYARALDGVRDVVHIPLLDGRVRDVLCALSLRHRNYDLLVLPFPATRWQYTVLSCTIGARQLVMHNYGGSSAFLGQHRSATLVALRGGHRVWENQRLAAAAGLRTTDDVTYLTPRSWKGAPKAGNMLGVHAGSMVYKGNEARRWPLEKFLKVIEMQIAIGRRVRLFVGPHEQDHCRYFHAKANLAGLEIVAMPLHLAAKKIAECDVFLSNDSGLGHLACGLNVCSVVVFGMTDPVRAAPVGNSIAVRPSNCPPCFDEGLRSFECAKNIGFRCLSDAMCDHVIEALERAFSGALSPTEPVQMGQAQLYGKTLTF